MSEIMVSFDWYEIDRLRSLIEHKMQHGVGVFEAKKLIELDQKLSNLRNQTRQPDDWDL
jgi:hypothetical protein